MIEYKTPLDFPRGTLYDILCDAYSYDTRNRELWDANWRDSDRFFYDHPQIAEKYCLVSCLNGNPIGFVCWDPRHRPEYVEIGHNGIREAWKRHGFGRLQLKEALERIQKYDSLRKITVHTNSNLVAVHNYESVGFRLVRRERNDTESAYTGDHLYYEIVLTQ